MNIRHANVGLINHTSRPSTRPSTSPPKTGNQTPSSPVSDSLHYAPHTSNFQTPFSRLAAAGSSHSALPSTSESRPRIPSTDTVSRTASGKTASRIVHPQTPFLGTLLLSCGEGSRSSGLALQRPVGSRGCRSGFLGRWGL